MAQKVRVDLVDDLDGGEAAETVPFMLDGVSYEIDLSADNAAALREELATYVGMARRTGGRKRRATAPAGNGALPDGVSTRDVRAWAVDNGWAVSERGRIPAAVYTAYEQAQREPKAGSAGRKRARRTK